VLVFRSSFNLAAAYGLAVSGVMLTTSIALIAVARIKWEWPWWKAIAVFGFFGLIEGTLLLANFLKFFSGGYVPVIVGIVFFIIMTTWRFGRHRVNTAYASYAGHHDMAWFVDAKRRLGENAGVLADRPRKLVETERTMVFLTSAPVRTLKNKVPPPLRIFMKRGGSLPQHLILLTIIYEKVPHIPKKDRYVVIDFKYGIMSVIAHFGFMQNPNIPSILRDLFYRHLLDPNIKRCSLQVGEEDIVIEHSTPFFDRIRLRLFRALLRFSVPAHRYFGVSVGSGFSKNVVPIVFSKEGFRLAMPEFSLDPEAESIDPDTLKPTDIHFIKDIK
jgi:KUP system potassium uptake protein